MTLKKDWQNYLSENVCNVLLANTQYLPETISEKDFDLCIEYCKNTEVDLPKSSGKIRILLESYEKECSQKKFYLKEGVHNSKLLECIPYSIIFAAKEKLYEKESIVPIFENCKVRCRSKEYIQEQETRKLDSLGCVINENEFISLGVINNQIVLIQELPDGKYCLKKNDSLFSKDVNENTSVDVTKSIANKSISINLKNEECVINFTLSDFVVSGEELSKEEFERIKNTFKTDKTNIYSDVWNRSFSEEGLESLFDTFIKEDGENFFSDTQKKEIIELRYEYKEKEYLPKTNVDLAIVNKYLSDYEDYYFEKIAFPYYEKSNEGDFYIVKENVVFNADYQKRLESLNIGYYSKCSYYILYNEEYEYPLFYEAINDLESSSAQKAYIEMLCGSDKGIIRQRINILENEEFPKLVFNSGEDFSKENLVKQKIIDDSLKISVKEKLYGGVNNWYYGVWIGLQNENEFSKSKLYKDYDKEYNESDFNNEAYEEKVKSESENENTIENQSVNFCLPSVIELYPDSLSSCVSTVSKTEMSYSAETKIPVQKSYQFAS